MKIKSKQVDAICRAAQALVEMDDDVQEVHIMFSNRDQGVRCQVTASRCSIHDVHVDVHMSTSWNRDDAEVEWPGKPHED